jgi:Transposase DDE domain group 1
MPSLHVLLDQVDIAFDDERAVASAGLLLPATLAERLGIEQATDRLVDLGDRPGAARPGRKLLTLVHAMVAGGDCIDDMELLRCGSTQSVLGHRVMAASTVGTFLRAFTFGHVRQLDRVCGELLARAGAAGAGPGDGPLTVDVDSTICEVHGYHKQGACYGYTHRLGYHPLLATRADTGEVLHTRLRKGSANTARGILRFVDELVARLRRAGACGELTLRIDSGFCRPSSSGGCDATGCATRSRCARPRPSAPPSPPSVKRPGCRSPTSRMGPPRSPRPPIGATG